MNNILTGQINLTALQNKVWIWIWQLTHYITSNWTTAITNYIHYQIIVNIIFLVALLYIWIWWWIMLYKTRKGNEAESTMEAIIFWSISIACIFGITNNLLWWWIAPEITFIQAFTN